MLQEQIIETAAEICVEAFSTTISSVLKVLLTTEFNP